MKVTGFSIPVGFELMASRVITPKRRHGSAVSNANLRKGTKVRATKKKAPKALNDFRDAAEFVAKQMHPKKTMRQLSPIIRSIVAELKSGVFNPRYWYLAPIQQQTYLECVPDSVEDTAPPPYNYRNSLKRPSIPTYTNGEIAADGMRYRGSLHGEIFKDDLLRWCRYNFRLNNPHQDLSVLFAFAVIQGSMAVAASHRGSKPMLSCITTGAIVPSTDPALTTLSPPTQGIAVSAPTDERGAQSHYWRYKLPASNPPYFAKVQLRPIVRSLTRMCSISAGGASTNIMLLLAPRPMFGRGFNNNDTVQTDLSADVKVWVIMEPLVPCSLTMERTIPTYLAGDFYVDLGVNRIPYTLEFFYSYQSGNLLITRRTVLHGLGFEIPLNNVTALFLTGTGIFRDGSGIQVLHGPNVKRDEFSRIYVEWWEFDVNYVVYDPHKIGSKPVRHYKQYANDQKILIDTHNETFLVDGIMGSGIYPRTTNDPWE